MSSAVQSEPLASSAEHPLDCVIVGAGPAGLAAGIYLQRFHRRVLLLDSGGHSTHAEREAGFLRDYGAEVSLVRLEGETPAPVATGLDVDAGLVRVTMSDGSAVRFDVLYAALGSTPQTGLAQPLHPTLDGQGNVVVDASCRTSVEGLFAAGDVVSALDQIAVAMGQGAAAATAVPLRSLSDSVLTGMAPSSLGWSGAALAIVPAPRGRPDNAARLSVKRGRTEQLLPT